MKNKITKLGSALVLAAIVIILSTTGSNQAKAERPERPPQYKHDVVVLKAVDMGLGVTDTNGYTFQYNGIRIENNSSSADALKFRRGSVPPREELTELAEAMAQLLDQGYKRVDDPKYFVFVKRSLR
jgi:hypothetical protein